jgi:NAD(P)H-hydrate epimerase
MPAIPVLSPAQAAQWDSKAAAAGISLETLMETAGRAVVQVLADRHGARLRQGVLVAAGPGNNGGDGWVIARALHRLGVPVWIAALPMSRQDGPAAAMAARARADGVREVTVDGPWPSAGLMVDAVLGTGASGPPRGAVRALLDRLAEINLPIVAVDGPSGLDLNDGVQHGPLQVALSVTFGGYRRGHLLARDDSGDVVVVDIGFPPADATWPTLFTDAAAQSMLPAFRAGFHKGDRGRIVIVGGGPGLTGAARMAARAAFAAGAGFVHLVAPQSSVATFAAAEPDLQTCIQPLDAPLGPAARALIEKAGAVIVGPGLGLHPTRDAIVVEVARLANRLVVDADALSAFAGKSERLRDAVEGRAAVLTPHLGEFRGLAPDLATDASVDPWDAARRAADRLGATLLLKGVPTVVARPGRVPVTIAAGNPGLATGGSGDTLSGFIGVFLAQGLEPEHAAMLGAQVLGRAADIAALRKSARAMRPMDVVDAVSDLWRGWDLASRAGITVRPPVLHQLERPHHA